MSGRSNYGCWTCRIRKKKCDETRPSCVRCTSLQIGCHGYGPRPYWMDRGELQREEACRLKRIVSQIKFNIRQQKLLGTSKEMRSASDTLAVGNNAASILPRSNPSKEMPLQSASTSKDHFQLPRREGDLSTLIEPLWSELFDSATLSTEAFYDQTVGINGCKWNLCHSEAAQESSESILPAMDEGATGNYADLPRQITQPEVNIEGLVLLSDPVLGTHGIDLSGMYGHGDEANLSLLTQKNSIPAPECQPIGLNHPVVGGETEDNLFMYYFDQVFYIHCPFYFPTNKRGRGWLFSILKRERSAYHAALALSEYHQSTAFQRTSSQVMGVRGKHYHLALQELQVCLGRFSVWNGSLGLAQNMEVLTSILHLLFYEIINGGKHNWQMHLRAANAFIPPLVQAQVAAIEAINKHANGEQDSMTFRSEEHVAISFLLGFFISISIIACASTRSSPILTLDPKLMLTMGEINLSILTGCSNWAMVLIFEIASLDMWREEQSKAQKLSLIELTNRGREIEARLRKRLADIEDEPPSDLGLRTGSDNTKITMIFALSSITYLHVVISGAYSDIPEIRESVSKTIDALQSLPDPKLLRHVAWPFCISGCLAVDGQQHLFRELASSPHMTQSCLAAFEIMKECWQLRKTGSCGYDWARIMRQKGESILLA